MFPAALIGALLLLSLALPPGIPALAQGETVQGAAPVRPTPPARRPPRTGELPLRDAVAEYLLRSPDLASDRLVPTIATIQQALEAERFRPQVRLDGRAGRQPFDGTGVSAGPAVTTNLPGGGTVRTGVEYAPGSRLGNIQAYGAFEQPLLRGAGEQAAQVQLRIATLQRRIAELAIAARASNAAAQFARDYALLDAALRRQSEAEDALRRAREQLRMVRTLVERGVLASGDALEIETSALSRELEVADSGAEARRQRELILGLLGRPLNQALLPVLPDPMTWRLPDETDLVAGASRRPEVQLQALRILVAEENKLLAIDGLRWDVSIVGDLRANTQDENTWLSADRRVGSLGVAYGIGLRLSVPITTQAAELRVRQADAEVQRNRLELQAFQEQAERTVRQRHAQLRRELDRLAIGQRLLTVNEQKLALEARRLQLGRSSTLQFRLAEEEFLRARAQLTTDRGRLLLSWIDLLNAAALFQLPP
jgi:outer membrane protein TolC